MALVHLIASGHLHKLVERYDHSAAEAPRIKDEVVSVLAFLFARVYRRKQTTETLKEQQRTSPSSIVLQRPRPEIIQSLEEHHKSIIDTFSGYAVSYASQYADKLGEDNRLPLSSTAVGSPADKTVHQGSQKPIARSSFVATSGLEDHFTNVRELAETARAGVHLNANALPSLTHMTSDQHELDAYAFDFWRHGQLAALVAGNGMRKGEVWYRVCMETSCKSEYR